MPGLASTAGTPRPAPPGLGRVSDDGTDPTYGLGLQALRGEYSRFEMEGTDVDLAQLQVRFDF